jgi:uncharacterized membrane protein YccC
MVRVATWLTRRDPGLRAVRQAVRTAAAACIGFYACRYWLDDPVMATYALFGAVALGALSQIPGSATQRARTMVAVLPVAALLILLGTALAVSTWAAVSGMLVVGFAVAFAGVGGPRLVGLAAGLQLFYILPGFPPYAPDTIGSRLIGVSVGILLLALAQLLLWPDRAPEGYEPRLARAAPAAMPPGRCASRSPACQSWVGSPLPRAAHRRPAARSRCPPPRFSLRRSTPSGPAPVA